MVRCCWTELQSQVRDIAEALLVVGVTWVNPNLINIKDFFVKYNLIPVLSSYWDLCMPARLFICIKHASSMIQIRFASGMLQVCIKYALSVFQV